MPKGGSRNGTPGRSYGSRTDLNAVKPLTPRAAPGQTYGAATAQVAAQEAVPMAAAPEPLAPLNRPSERPTEPVTAGMNMGPGPGSEAIPDFGDDAMTTLRAIYSRYPTEELRALIEEAGRE